LFVLLSNEYPIAEIACDEHDESLAVNVKGDDTVAPLAGEETVGVANAVAAANSSELTTAKFVQIFMSARYLTKKWNEVVPACGNAWPPGHVHAGTPVALGFTEAVFALRSSKKPDGVNGYPCNHLDPIGGVKLITDRIVHAAKPAARTK
jgi:hypothetical protein